MKNFLTCFSGIFLPILTALVSIYMYLSALDSVNSPGGSIAVAVFKLMLFEYFLISFLVQLGLILIFKLVLKTGYNLKMALTSFIVLMLLSALYLKAVLIWIGLCFVLTFVYSYPNFSQSQNKKSL
jgi:hypothetical protein